MRISDYERAETSNIDYKEKLKNADILHMTPLEAINFIYELKEELK